MNIAAAILLISLLGIIVMVGRKLSLIRREEAVIGVVTENPFLPDLEKVKYVARKKARRYGYIALFIILRMYIHSANFLKKKGLELAKRIEEKLEKRRASLPGGNGEKQEVNKYLKMISQYRMKVRRMKRMIRQEDGIE